MNRTKLMVLLLVTLVTGVLAAAGGIWIILTPQNWLVRQFRGPIAESSAGIVIGPYPLQDDIDLLKSQGVTLLVSLMDPQIPYEAILIERERKLAEQRGLRFENYPMTSVLGRRFGSHNETNAQKAAVAVQSEKGRVYLHCYLGVHRVKSVEKLVQASGGKTARYLIRQSRWSPEPPAQKP